jgi:3-oxoacyl-[acyl-carrier-protein] synthase I
MIAIEAAGAVTPVGTNLTETVGGLYTGVQLFEDLGVLDEEGEPLSGMKIPFPEGLNGPERLLAMANAVVDEATLTIEPSAKIPLLLCLPESGTYQSSLPEWPANLLSSVIANAAVPLDLTRSRVIARGKAGLLEALGAALALLKEPAMPYCLVGGVDSFVDDERVAALFGEGRVLSVGNKDGYVPGEAGAMLLLTNRPSPGVMARWLSAAAGTEDACRGSDGPITGTGLRDAMAKALAQAKVDFNGLDCLAHDFSGEQRYFEELLLATPRLSSGHGNHTVEVPASSTGETGAAAGFVAIAMLAFLHSKAVHKRASMAVLSSDGTERGAVVLGHIERR